jgi:hypothetical protein
LTDWTTARVNPEMQAELRRLLDASTPGPWRDEMMQGKGVNLTAIIAGRPNPDDLRVIGSTLAHNDARVLIAAVNALPALLDAAELLADVRDQVTRGALCPPYRELVDPLTAVAIATAGGIGGQPEHWFVATQPVPARLMLGQRVAA